MGRLLVREIEIENLRTIERLRLPLSGLTVLIGENGSGKSSIIEAVELLRRIGAGTFEPDFREVHGGPELLLRRGATRMALGASVEDVGSEHAHIRYRVELTSDPRGYTIDRELFHASPYPGEAQRRLVLERNGLRTSARLPNSGTDYQLDPRRPLLADTKGAFSPHPAIARLREALAALEVHVGFEVTPQWVARATRRESALRDRSPVNREEHLSRLGSNLAAAFHTLKNEHPHNEQWQRVLDWIRLGIGYHIGDVLVQAAGQGYVELSLKLRGVDAPIRSAALSNGQLSWLAFVALAHLGVEQRPLLAFDEPELHLHPALLVRATQLLVELSAQHPVLIATHSRRILDALGEDAADAAVLCEYAHELGVTRLRRFDRGTLRDWLEDYDGLGKILDAGYERHLLTPCDEVDASDASKGAV